MYRRGELSCSLKTWDVIILISEMVINCLICCRTNLPFVKQFATFSILVTSRKDSLLFSKKKLLSVSFVLVFCRLIIHYTENFELHIKKALLFYLFQYLKWKPVCIRNTNLYVCICVRCKCSFSYTYRNNSTHYNLEQ